MKINKVMNAYVDAAVAPTYPSEPPAPQLVEDDASGDEQSVDVAAHSLIFQPSDRFKHMLTLIARDNKELYNRIIGLE